MPKVRRTPWEHPFGTIELLLRVYSELVEGLRSGFSNFIELNFIVQTWFMGLDSVELVMEVEKTFGINIPDSEAEQLLTVGDLQNCVWKHVEGRNSDKCKSQSLFYKLRSSIADNLKISKQEFKLDTSLNEIFPRENRRQLYLNFSKENGLELPDLVLTKPWSNFIIYFGLTNILGTLVVSIILINFFDYSKWTLLFSVAGIIITVLVSKTLNPFRTVIQPAIAKDYTKRVLVMNYTLLSKDIGTNRKEIESVIKQIISDKCGLEIEEISPEKKFGDDLGID